MKNHNPQASTQTGDWTALPQVHAGVYFMLALQSLVWAGRQVDDAPPHVSERLNLTAFPAGLVLTTVCRHVWPHHFQPHHRTFKKRHVVLGSGLAMGTLGVYLWVQTHLGWLSWNQAGQPAYTMAQRWRTLGFLTVAHGAVAYNEETVFRGHGFTVLSHAIGSWGAGGVLIPLFGAYHLDTLRWVSLGTYSIAGFNYTMMRYLSGGGLAMPMAYHWTWNWLQTAAVGTGDQTPTLIRVQSHGPERWVGTFGQSYPGLLMLLIRALLAVVLGTLAWRRRKQSL